MARMKKAPAGRRAPAAKGSGPGTFDEYLASVPESARPTLLELRSIILSAVPADAAETISYRMPAIRYKGVLLWFAAFSSHCSLFPTAAVMEAFKKELKGFATSKGTIRFPADRPLPAALVRKIVKARVAQVEGKTRR